MKLALRSDGTPYGSRVIDEDTGEVVQQVQQVIFTHRAGQLPELEVTLCMPKIEAVGMPVRYYIPDFGYVKALILEDGTQVPTNKE